MGKIGKNLLVALISILVFVEFFGLILLPKPARAQAPTEVYGGPVSVITTVDIPAEKKAVKETVGAQLLGSALGALVHGFSYFMRKLAYDSAMYVAHGGKGQGALAFKQGFGAYLETVALDSAADAIGELGKPFGLNLCKPPDLNVQVFLQIGLRGIYFGTEGPKPNCTWQEWKGSWENIEEKYFGENGQLTTERMFSNALRFESTDFGIAVGAMERVDRIQSSQVAGAQAERMEGEGFKAFTSLITGDVKTPAQVIKEETYAATNKHQSTLTASQVAGIYGSGALQVIPLAGSVFLNTLAAEGIKTLQEEFLSWFDEGGGGEEVEGALSFESAGFQMSLKKAKEVFSSFLAVTIEQRENYDLLTEFTTCPDLISALPGLNNCVMDDSLREAVRRADTGEPMTIREALKEGLLRGDRILASPKRVENNTSPSCYKDAYCYSNIQKMRRSRILPLGFEIAALMADPDHPELKWKLQDVVDGFNDCKDEDGDGVVESDPVNHPYCHLIDPNWILKAPAQRCNALVYGPNLTDQNSSSRAQECMDIQTRISGSAGFFRDFFGYCTREKKVWRLPGEACESYYNTCTTYADEDGAFASYLARTLDYGECSLDSVGCLAYSTEKKDDGWVASIDAEGIVYKQYGRNQALYFNEKIKNYTCSASDNGCSAFYLGTLNPDTDKYFNNYDSPIFIKKAPDYLGCYDVSQNTPQIEWPETKPELMKVSQDKACADFAQVCLPEEVGCDSYTPKKGPSSVPIPGTIGKENECEEVCVGYDTFKQNKTEFAPSEFPLYFIPQEGKSCPGYVGCDEFTNIDELAKGGEGLEYYYDIKYCELPNDENQKVFYSWYGSQSEGYVLKLHKLRPVNQKDNAYLNGLSDLDLGDETVNEFFPVGSPAYATDDPEELNVLYAECNAVGYNILINGGTEVDGAASTDCRALYDKDGEVYYRLLKDTITVSEECHPLRKTIAYFYDDAALKTQGTCEERGGYWNEDKCQRCTNGGIYKDGACVYWAIAKPGESQSCNGPANNKGAYNGCREYVGNEGNDTETVFYKDFEPIGDDLSKAKEGWMPADEVQVVSESVQVGLHSLQVTQKADQFGAGYLDYLVASSTLESGGWYKLSFWARGKTQKLGVYFLQKIDGVMQSPGTFTSADYKLSIGDDWKEYKIGPIQFTGDPLQDVILVFESKTQSPPVLYFLDNVELRYVPDTFALIKDSWKTKFPYNGQSVSADVPLACDANPTDPFPGDALGCRAYSEESTGNTVYVTGFEKLCREEAVGCRAVFDTYNKYNADANTQETEMTAYNVWCKGAVGDSSCQLKNGETVLGKCDMAPGKSGCYVEKITVPNNVSFPSGVANAHVRPSTIIIPADTPEDQPIFLTYRPEFKCLDKSKGCQELGAEEQVLPEKSSSVSYQHNATYLLNDPAQYVGANGVLCRDDLVGCEGFKAGSDIFFFKNPVKTGNSFCEYKKEVDIGGMKYNGWFLKDFGVCYTSATPSVKTDQICGSDSDCEEGETCKDKGQVPCYSDYLKAGGFYDIWSNETLQYKGKVGVCPSEKNGCSELIDPADISQIHPDGEPYYVIFDNLVTGKLGECELKASQVEGCVLFNKTDEPNLLYDSVQTYKNSEEKNFAPVSLVTNTDNKDSNWLLKVIRDRECAEWLSCRGSLPVPDSQSLTGERYSCYALQPCAESINNLECLTESTLSDEIGGELDYAEYILRDVSWSASREFSGYSLFAQRPVIDLEYITVSKTADNGLERDAIFVGYVNRSAQAAADCKKGVNDNGKECGSGGICYDKKCVYSPDDSYPSELWSNQTEAKNNFYKYLYKADCRGYPEQDSPFPGEYESLQDQAKYNNAEFCAVDDDGKIENCDCNYIKVDYGNSSSAEETKYYKLGGKLNQDLQKGGICQGGPKPDDSCSSDKDCADKDNEANSGTCIKQFRRNTRIGWNGYCLERDLSRHVNGRLDSAPDAFACMTWLPLDYVPGLFDIYYSDPSVGYVPPTGAGNPGQAYCTEMLGVGGLIPGLNFKCKIGEVFSGNAPLDNTCQDDLPSSYGETPIVFEGYNEEEIQFSQIQSHTLDLIDALSGTGSGFVPQSYDYGTYHYVGRVDVAIVPDKNDSSALWDTPGGEWDDNYADYGEGFYVKSSGGGSYGLTEVLLDYASALLMDNSVFYAMAMSQGGYIASNQNKTVPYAPLFPDVESFGEEDGSGSWLQALEIENVAIDKSATSDSTDADKYNLIIESDPVKNLDSGVLRHRETKAETFLTKDMIYAVSFVPMWLSEGGDDDVGQYAPAMGYPMTIYMDKDYPEIGGQADDLDMKKSAAGSKCVFCKYWVAKTDHPNDDLMNKNQSAEGYLLQWFAGDPTSPDAWLDESVVMAYANPNSYLVNPLDAGNVQCKNKPGDDGNHFIAVEVLFDKESGEFIGYRSRNCMERGDAETGYAMAVIFTLKPMCVEAVKVIGPDGLKNKAYTDRVWSGGEEIIPNTAESNFVDYDADAAPFGSARFDSLENCESDNPWCYLQRSPAGVTSHGGTPWQCLSEFKSDAGVLFGGSCPMEEGWQGKYIGYNRTQEATGYVLGNPSYVNSQKYLLFDSLFATLYGKSSRLSGGEYQLNNAYPDIVNALNQQENQLHRFVGDKTYNYLYDPSSQSLKAIGVKIENGVGEFPTLNYNWLSSENPDDLNTSLDIIPVVLFGDHASFRGVPPRMYPAIDCAGPCELDKSAEGFAVNGISGKKADDQLFGVGTLMAQVKFFAWADHNQMPLRRIMVDWREKGLGEPNNTISGTSMGYYTNYKPYCGGDSGEHKECVVISNGQIITGNGQTCDSDKECPLSHPTCKDVGAKFGNQSGQSGKTCKDSPVIRIFNYTCDADQYPENDPDLLPEYIKLVVDLDEPVSSGGFEDLGKKWQNFLKEKGYDNFDRVCVFQPRAQVLDNWGWCTGSCDKTYKDLTPPDANKATNGCYAEYPKKSTLLTATDNQCDPYIDWNLVKLYPWLNFNNIIIVAPSEQ